MEVSIGVLVVAMVAGGVLLYLKATAKTQRKERRRFAERELDDAKIKVVAAREFLQTTLDEEDAARKRVQEEKDRAKALDDSELADALRDELRRDD